jgi:hypothetical protein
MVFIRSDYKMTDKSFLELKIHRRLRKTTSPSVTMSEETTLADLAKAVVALSEQMKTILDWIAQQDEEEDDDAYSTRTIKSPEMGPKYKNKKPPRRNEEESTQLRPFKVDARIDIPTCDRSIDAEKLDSWLSQLETYFDLYGYSSEAKVSFVRLKLTNHALTWWNSFLVSHPDEVSWEKFTLLILKDFYSMGFEEDRWSRWHSLRQRRDQFIKTTPQNLDVWPYR